jgi:WD40 repeat protein
MAPPPALAMIRSNVLGWRLHSRVPREDSGTPKTLICIAETRKESGKYDDGEKGYETTWEIRLLKWPEGTVVGKLRRISIPPSLKRSPGAGFGEAPVSDLGSRLLSGKALITEYAGKGKLTRDGRALALATRGEMRVVEPRTGKARLKISGPKSAIATVDLSTDGSIMAVGESSQFFLRDGSTGKKIGGPFKNAGGSWDAKLSPDGKFLVTIGSWAATLWDVKAGRSVAELKLRNLAFSADGRSLAGVDSGGFIQLWDVQSGQQVGTIGKEKSFVQDLSFTPDGKAVAVATSEKVTLWDLTAQAAMKTIEIDHPMVIALSADGKLLAVVTNAGRIEICEMASGHKLSSQGGHIDEVTYLAFSPDGSFLVSANGPSDFKGEGTTKLWDVARLAHAE